MMAAISAHCHNVETVESLHASTAEHCAALTFHSCHSNKVTFYFSAHTKARAQACTHTRPHAQLIFNTCSTRLVFLPVGYF